MKKHYCDTDHPQRPCCWAARRAEFARMEADELARNAKYGASRCPACHKVYRVTDGVVENHAARCEGGLTDEQMWR